MRTLDDVGAADAKRDPAIARAMASMMLRHGRLTIEAREWIAREYLL